MIIDNPTISGSALLSGSLTITGSLNVSGSISGLTSNAVSASYALSSSFATNGTSASFANNASTASYVLNAVSASYALNASNALSSSYAATSSFANDLTVAGTITAQKLNVQQVTSSVIYSSGSNVFGNSLSNTQVMTGSVGITGSLSVNGVLTGTSATFSSTAATSVAGTFVIPVEGSATNSVALVAKTSNGGNDIFRWFDGNTQLGVFKNSGNVGIGTASNINQRLTILDNNDAEGLGVYRNFSAASDAGTYIRLGALNGSSVPTTGAAILGALEGSKTAGYLTFLTVSASTLSERMRITSGGLVGIGVTPNAWFTSGGYRVLQIGAGLSLDSGNDFRARLASNAYVNTSGDWAYANAGFASNYIQTSGTHVWSTAPSGAAGNAITFTERMTITSGGDVGIGTSSPAYKLDVYSATSPATIGLKTDATYNSVFRDYIATTDTYLDITTERTDGGGFNFLLLVSSTLTASGANRNYYTFAVAGRGTTATATQLSNVTAGTSSRTAIAVSFPSNGVIRLTLTGAETCQIKVTAMGHGSL